MYGFPVEIGELSERPGGSLPFLLIFALTFLGRSWITQGTSAGFSFVDTPVQYRSDPWLRLATYLHLVAGFNHTFPLAK